MQRAFAFLSEYVSFIQTEQPELQALAETINSYCSKRFEAFAKEAAAHHKKDILLIPDDVKADAKHLGTLLNGQFVSAFRELQEILIRMYESIGKSPYDRGYPDYYTTSGPDRVIDFLFALVFCGIYHDESLTVDMKKFSVFTSVKRHKKPDSKQSTKNKKIHRNKSTDSLFFCVKLTLSTI